MLRSTYDSLVNAAAGRFPWLPVVGVAAGSVRFRRGRRAGDVPRLPDRTGTADGTVPLRVGRAASRGVSRHQSAGGEPKTWHAVPSGTHNALRRAGGAAYAGGAEAAWLNDRR